MKDKIALSGRVYLGRDVVGSVVKKEKQLFFFAKPNTGLSLRELGNVMKLIREREELIK